MAIDKDTGAVNGILPKQLLKPGESVEVPGSGNKPYKMKRLAGRDEYTCSCPTWQTGGSGNLTVAPTRARTCRHLQALLGEAYEEARLSIPIIRSASSSSPAMTPIPAPSKTAAGPKRKRATSNASAATTISAGPTPATSPSPAPTTTGAISVMLAHTFDLQGTKSPVGMWASEKLDGVRAHWDGQRLWSRTGKPYLPPNWWKARLPTDVQLDGELFHKRDYFDTTSGWVRGGVSDNWSKIHFVVFDVVDFNKPLEERWTIAKSRAVVCDGEMSVDAMIERGGSLVVLLPQVRVESRQHMDEMLDVVESVGGEGLMLRQPGSYYKSGRSRDLLKVKTFYDAEGVVIAYMAGTGKNEGKVGALKLMMANGMTFDCGTGLTDRDRQYPPPRGSIVKYAFQEMYPGGAPRFPSYKGVAIDKTEPKDAVVRSTLIRLANGTGTGSVIGDAVQRVMAKKAKKAKLGV